MANYIIDISGKNIQVARLDEKKQSLQILDSYPSIIGFLKEKEDIKEIIGRIPSNIDEEHFHYISLFDNFLRHSSLLDETDTKRHIIQKIYSILFNRIRKKGIRNLENRDQIFFILPVNFSAEFAIESINFIKNQNLPGLKIINDLECALHYCFHSAINKIEIKDWMQLNKKIKIYFFDIIKDDLNLYVTDCTINNGNSEIKVERAKVLSEFFFPENKQKKDDLWENEIMDTLLEDFGKILFFFIKRDSDGSNSNDGDYIRERISILSEPENGKRVRELKTHSDHNSENIELYGAWNSNKNKKNITYNLSIGLKIDDGFFCEIIPKNITSFPCIFKKAFKIDIQQKKLRFDFYMGTNNRIEYGWLLKSIGLDLDKFGLMVSEARQIDFLITLSLDNYNSGKISIENINRNLRNGELKFLCEEVPFELSFNLYNQGEK